MSKTNAEIANILQKDIISFRSEDNENDKNYIIF